MTAPDPVCGSARRSPVAVGIAVAFNRTGTRLGWAVRASDDHEHSAVASVADPKAGFLAALEYVLSSPVFFGRDVEIFCADADFVAEVTPFVAAWPHLVLHPWTEERQRGILVRRAGAAARRLFAEETAALIKAETDAAIALAAEARLARRMAAEDSLAEARSRPVLIAATDGSANRLNPSRRVTGYGWITSEGHHGRGTIKGDTLIAEIAAMADLLTRIPLTRRIKVMVDSKAALRVIDQYRRGTPPDQVPFHGFATRMPYLCSLAADVHARRDRVTFEWVPAHSGHPLNEGADRLAVHARRAHDLKVAPDVAEATVHDIVADTMRAHRAHEASETPAPPGLDGAVDPRP